MKRWLKYLFGGRYRPEIPSNTADSNGIVILVHGLLHRSWVMDDLGHYLSHRGFKVYIYDYPTTRKGIEAHGAEFRDWLRDLIKELPANQKVNLVTHSMGGLISRYALGDDSVIPESQRGNWIMLAVPHKGSPMASRWMRRLPHLGPFLVHPLPQLCEEPNAVPALPFPNGWNIGSVIGRYDRHVPSGYSDYTQGEFRVVDYGHTFIMNSAQAQILICNFLKKGIF